MICVYDSKTTDFSNNGLVVLNDCKSCFIEEKLNDSYESTLEYPLDFRGKWENLIEDNILKVDGQLFRIYHKSKSLNGIQINAIHIFYDLLDNFIEGASGSGDCAASMTSIMNNTQYPHNFNCTVLQEGLDKIAPWNLKEINPVAAILGQKGIIDTFGGEIIRDNYNITIKVSRGSDNGVLISYGKNIEEIEQTLDMSNLCTRLYPKGKDGLLLTEKYVDSPLISNYAHPYIKVIEFNDIDNEADLRTATQNYFTSSKCDYPVVNYNIKFLELSKTEEYRNYAVLETVNLGDTVTVKHTKLNINLKCKVIRVKKNVLTGRIEELELGNFKDNFITSFNSYSSLLSNITTSDGQLKGDKIQGIIDATKASLRAMADSATRQTEKAILFEDRDINSLTYGAMALGTSGFEIASTMIGSEWQWSTFGTGKGFVADLIVAGKILGGCVEFNLDEGYLKINHNDNSYTLINADGINRYIGGAGKEYHYLCEVGNTENNMIWTSNHGGQSATANWGEATVTLPSEFKGKNFKVVATYQSGWNVPALWSNVRYGVYVDSIDVPDGTFVIKGYLYAEDSDGNVVYGDGSSVGGIVASYIVIA